MKNDVDCDSSVNIDDDDKIKGNKEDGDGKKRRRKKIRGSIYCDVKKEKKDEKQSRKDLTLDRRSDGHCDGNAADDDGDGDCDEESKSLFSSGKEDEEDIIAVPGEKDKRRNSKCDDRLSEEVEMKKGDDDVEKDMKRRSITSGSAITRIPGHGDDDPGKVNGDRKAYRSIINEDGSDKDIIVADLKMDRRTRAELVSAYTSPSSPSTRLKPETSSSPSSPSSNASSHASSIQSKDSPLKKRNSSSSMSSSSKTKLNSSKTGSNATSSSSPSSSSFIRKTELKMKSASITAASAVAPASCSSSAVRVVQRNPKEDEPSFAPLDFSIKSNSSSKTGRENPNCQKTQNKDVSSIKGKDTTGESPLDLSVKRSDDRSSKSKPSTIPNKISFDGNRESKNSCLWNYPSHRSATPPKSGHHSKSPESASSSSGVINQASNLWNGSSKHQKNVANLHLQSNKSSSVHQSQGIHIPPSNPRQPLAGNNSHGVRQNPWQTQWINRSSEQTRDVFTCVWCKESFRSLQEMTEHMKASPRCGMAGMQHAAAQLSASSATTAVVANQSPSASPSSIQINSSLNSKAVPSSQASSGSPSPGKEPMSSAVLAKNSMNLPRKLVRGQDVWLGRGAEQTRQILKCNIIEIFVNYY